MVPLDLPEKGLAASNFGMLGLGDIVIPGKYRAGFEREREREIYSFLICRSIYCTSMPI